MWILRDTHSTDLQQYKRFIEFTQGKKHQFEMGKGQHDFFEKF